MNDEYNGDRGQLKAHKEHIRKLINIQDKYNAERGKPKLYKGTNKPLLVYQENTMETMGNYLKWRRGLVCAKSVVSRSLVSLGLLYYDYCYKCFLVVLHLVTTWKKDDLLNYHIYQMTCSDAILVLCCAKDT